MPKVVIHPDTSYTLVPAGAGHVPEAVVITVAECVYTFTAQDPRDVPIEHLASVQAQLTSIFGTLANAPVCVVTPTGGAAGVYDYQVIPFNDQGDDLPPTSTHITTGPTTLDGTHYNTITWTDIANARGYRVRRVSGGPSQGLIATVVPGVQTFRDDNSEGAATVYTPSAANPAMVGSRITPE